MTASARFRTMVMSAVLLTATVMSFAGPSIASTIRLLDDDGSPAASTTRTPLDAAAALDLTSETSGESAEADGPSRLPGIRSAAFDPEARLGPVIHFTSSTQGHAPSGQALLCVYRL